MSSLERLKADYDSNKNKVYSEDLFIDESWEDCYKTLRDLSLSASEYIKALEKRVKELEEFNGQLQDGTAFVMATLASGKRLADDLLRDTINLMNS